MWTGWVGGAMCPWLGGFDGVGVGVVAPVGAGFGDVGAPCVGAGFEGAVGPEIGAGAEVGLLWPGLGFVVGLGAEATGLEPCVGCVGCVDGAG